MTRLALPLAVATAALVAAAPALAADYGSPGGGGSGYSNFFGNSDDLRSGFSQDWDNSDASDPLSFELGLRYWYSMGAQSFSVSGSKLTESGSAHSAEGQFRIDDHSSKFYAKGLAGLSFAISGSGDNEATSTATTVTDGSISYAGADIGYSWLDGGNKAPSFGPFAGYMYWNDSPDTGRQNFIVGTSDSDFSFDPAGSGNHIIGPGDSKEDDIIVNALRLGFSGKANFGNMFDVTGEVAAVPYAKINGTLGAFGVPVSSDATYSVFQSSAASLDGWGYGAMGEVMLGFHPTENLTFRVGGRAWYLQGQADTTFNTIRVTNDASHTVSGQQEYISTANPWSLFRYGLLTEMTYNF